MTAHMRFYKNLYVSESMTKKKEKVIAKLNKKKISVKYLCDRADRRRGKSAGILFDVDVPTGKCD